MNIHPKLLSDEKIIDLFGQRDEQAISQTDTKYGKYLYKIAYNIAEIVIEKQNGKDFEEERIYSDW